MLPAVRPAETSAIPGWDPSANAPLKTGDWPQWGGTSYRNNTPIAAGLPITWNVGEFDRQTGEWIRDEARAHQVGGPLGKSKLRQPRDRRRPGLRRHQQRLRLLETLSRPTSTWAACSVSAKSDGKFLWQHSSEKLPTGRVHDWPLQGICCAPLVEGNRLWFVTSRGCIVCLDTEGFHDGEDDGPVQNELGRLFDVTKNEDPAKDELAPDRGGAQQRPGRAKLCANCLRRAAWSFPQQIDLKVEEAGKKWSLSAQVGAAGRQFRVQPARPAAERFQGASQPTTKTRPISSGATT